MKGVVIAGVASGVGKTTVAMAIMAALTRRGEKVQPFKIGPDYIDPSYHSGACDRPCRNLDSWLLEPDTIRELFHRAMAGVDMAVVEGVMGLYDGAGGETEEGSTAEIAKLLGLPVILVIDASKASRSVGAIGLGFRDFDQTLDFAGVILNGIASEFHLELAKPALADAGLRFLGYLPSKDPFRLPERHLGLVPTAEGRLPSGYYGKLAAQADATIDIDAITALAGSVHVPSPARQVLFPEQPVNHRASIAIASDEAFNFYYPDSLDLLRAWGAELVPFSPLKDDAVPAQACGVYIGGGFPERYAAELSRNRSMLASLRGAANTGLPIYAECGGLMYLASELEDSDGSRWQMAGILPIRSVMTERRLKLGYWTLRARVSNPLLAVGERVRGHEFHFSSCEATGHDLTTAYDILERPGRTEGFVSRGILASYIHLHFGTKPSLAPNFVQACSIVRGLGESAEELNQGGAEPHSTTY
jgi:cobyrinic acid a,c-diamide synthase